MCMKTSYAEYTDWGYRDKETRPRKTRRYYLRKRIRRCSASFKTDYQILPALVVHMPPIAVFQCVPRCMRPPALKSLRNTEITPKFFFTFLVGNPGNSTGFIATTKCLKLLLYLSSTLIFIHVLHPQQDLRKSYVCVVVHYPITTNLCYLLLKPCDQLNFAVYLIIILVVCKSHLLVGSLIFSIFQVPLKMNDEAEMQDYGE